MIKELHEKLKNKEITAAELLEKHFAVIKEKNENLNVFLETYEEEAMEQAKKVDEKIAKGEEIGLLEGIPCAFKDNICAEGKRTTSASKMLENYIAPYDATVTKKLKKEGMVLVGKTNLDEFAMGSSTENSAFGVTKNPHDETRVAGGSSGGSAAAVAANMAVWALGSDTGGSVRQPAGLCGLVGFKPTYGRVSRYGLHAMGSSYDQIGPFGKTVEDVAIIFDAIQGDDEKDNTTIAKEKTSFAENLTPAVAGKKIGVVSKEFFGEGLDAGVKKNIEEKIESLKTAEAEIVEIEMPHSKYSLAAYYIMVTSEISSNLARIDGMRFGLNETKEENSQSKTILDVYQNSRELGFGDEVKRRIILGTYALSSGYYDAYYKKAQAVREVIKNEFKNVFREVDVILLPTSPTPAFKIGEKSDDPLSMYLADIYTVTANVAMIPAISIPAGTTEVEGKNLPVGLQLMGKWWEEQELLNVAAGVESLERQDEHH